jgi:hypothetical protein
MVLMNASKSARNQQSIINRTNICGGQKKGGLTPRIGWQMQSNPTMKGATNTQFGLICIPNRTVQTQKYGYHAVHGGNMG